MRHSRSIQFAEAQRAATSARRSSRWTELSSDPNDPAALAARSETLRAAWRPPVADRAAFLADRCVGRSVLDVGCVAHDERRMDSPQWLHAHLASAADRCVGVDVLDSGVAAMNTRGYEAIVHDLGGGLGPLREIGPFGAIVAGELIEHVANLDMLFRAATEALSDDGELIITTPNPYAPSRVRAGRRGLVWENVDHIMYAFPSGIAELAERHGLVLSEAMTTLDRRRQGLVGRLKQMRRLIRGTRWLLVGYATLGERRTRRVSRGLVAALGSFGRGRRHWLTGETFIYVVRRCTTAEAT